MMTPNKESLIDKYADELRWELIQYPPDEPDQHLIIEKMEKLLTEYSASLFTEEDMISFWNCGYDRCEKDDKGIKDLRTSGEELQQFKQDKGKA